MSFNSRKLEQTFIGDLFFDDAELSDNIDNELQELLEPNFTGYLGLSPSHSSDSGVDILGEEFFAMENCSFAENIDRKEKKNMITTDVQDFDKIEVIERGESSNNRISGPVYISDPVKEDHCYTNKNSAENVKIPLSKPKASVQSKLSDSAEKCLSLDENMVASFSYDEDGLDSCTKGSLKCDNKNAVMARLNRQRKKRYVDNLESEVTFLRKQNKNLSSDNEELKDKLESCAKRVTYLENILANESMLSSVIKAVSVVPGINLSGTLKQNGTCLGARDETCTHGQTCKQSKTSNPLKRQIDEETNEDGDIFQAKKANHECSPDMGAGVCLHVNQRNVSIEMCHHCSMNAVTTVKRQTAYEVL